MRELKSSLKLSHKEKGLWCEWKCVEFLNNRNYILKNHRWKTPFGELDLLFYHQTGHWRAVEVKSSGFPVQVRVSRSQSCRLQNILHYLVEELMEPVSMDLAIVSSSGELNYFEDFLC